MKTKIVFSFLIFLVSASFLVINSTKKENNNEALLNININSSIYNYDITQITNQDRIKYLTYGRCSDYKAAEEVQKDSLDWFYRYNEHDENVSCDYIDDSEFGNGITVRKCEAGVNKEGYVMQKLISNKEQINITDEKNINICNRIWYVIPKIRINPEFVNDFKLDTIKVCRLEVVDYNGKIIDSVTLRAINFMRVPNEKYDGKYMERYFLFSNPNKFVRDDSLFAIDSSGVLCTKKTKNNICKINYRIYWYGECDMWVDRIRVCNQVAFDLFDENSNNSQHQTYMNWIKRFAGTESPGAAGFGLLNGKYEYNKQPVIKYINDKILEFKEKGK